MRGADTSRRYQNMRQRHNHCDPTTHAVACTAIATRKASRRQRQARACARKIWVRCRLSAQDGLPQTRNPTAAARKNAPAQSANRILGQRTPNGPCQRYSPAPPPRYTAIHSPAPYDSYRKPGAAARASRLAGIRHEDLSPCRCAALPPSFARALKLDEQPAIPQPSRSAAGAGTTRLCIPLCEQHASLSAVPGAPQRALSSHPVEEGGGLVGAVRRRRERPLQQACETAECATYAGCGAAQQELAQWQHLPAGSRRRS
jgi:hypothetical protein